MYWIVQLLNMLVATELPVIVIALVHSLFPKPQTEARDKNTNKKVVGFR